MLHKLHLVQTQCRQLVRLRKQKVITVYAAIQAARAAAAAEAQLRQETINEF